MKLRGAGGAVDLGGFALATIVSFAAFLPVGPYSLYAIGAMPGIIGVLPIM